MIRIALGFILTLLVRFAAAQPDTISYTLSMEAPHTHYFEVEMTLKGVDRDTLDFKMPVWTPGSYLVREFSRHVEAFQAEDRGGVAHGRNLLMRAVVATPPHARARTVGSTVETPRMTDASPIGGRGHGPCLARRLARFAGDVIALAVRFAASARHVLRRRLC